MAFAPCICCHVPFGFNPLTVPSTTAFTGQREAVCEPCMKRVNEIRADAGLPPFPIAADAYQPIEEAALP